MATKPVETSDEFDAAFASFANPADPDPAGSDAAADLEAGSVAAGDPDPDAAGGDPGAAGADPDTGGDSSDAGGGDPDPAAAGSDPAPVVEPKDDPATDALINRLADLVKEVPAPKAEPAPAAAEPAAEIYTPEEKEFLTKYDEDWADVTRGEALKSRERNNQLIQYVFSQIAQELKPYLETIDTLSTRTHLSDIRATVGEDYDDLREKVVSWATSSEQPAYLQNAYKQVIQSGTVEDVNDLINRYRAATGAAATPSPAAAKPELSDDAKKAAKALAPVSTKRSGIPQDDDKNDFDSAFQRFSVGFNRS